MCPTRLHPPRDPRLREMRKRRQPEVEKPQETLPEWRGVLLMADIKQNMKMHRIAEVTCRPAPPLPLPERLQVNNEFTKLDSTQYQVCIGLPFFELHKINFIYHPDSEWSKFLDFMHKSHKFATIVCEGWQLFVRPPQVGPPDGFSSVRVHYRRKAEPPLTESPTLPVDTEFVEGPALSFQDWASDPSASGADVEANSLEVLPKGSIDFTAKLSCQPNVKRPRVVGAFDGFRKTGTGAPSSSQEKDVQEIVAKASDKPETIGNCMTDISYDISPSGFDHVSKPPFSGDNKWGSEVADKGKGVRIAGASDERVPKPSCNGNGNLGNGATLGAAPGSDWMKRYVAEAAVPKPPSGVSDISATEKCLQASGSSQGVPSGVNEKVPEMVISDGATTSGAAPAKEDQRKKYVAEAAVLKPPSGGIDTGVMEARSQASGSLQVVPDGVTDKVLEMVGSHEATSGAVPGNDDWWKNEIARSGGSDSGAVEKPSRLSGSAQVVKEKAPEQPLGKLKVHSNGVSAAASEMEKSRGPPYKCSPSDMIALRKSSQAKEKLKGVQGTSSNVEVPLPPSYINEDLTLQKGSKVADKGEDVSSGGPGVSLKKQVSKPSSNGNGKVRKVLCLPKVPEQFRVNIKTPTEEQMSKPPSSANGAFQKQTCSQPEAKLQGVMEKEPNPSRSLENSVEQNSSKEAVNLNGVTNAPSGSTDRVAQQTRKFRAFARGVTRSKPQKLKIKKSSTGGSSEVKGSTSTSDAKQGKNCLQQWFRVIHNILQFMYLAEERGATRVDVDVEEVYWSVEKRNVVAVTIADNGKGMSHREVECFHSKMKDNSANHLILLTKTEKEKLVGIIHKNDLWGILYPKYDEGTEETLDAIEILSPFSSAHIKSEFSKMDTRGTRMIVYGYEDLVFKQPKENVKVEKFVQTTGQNEDVSQVTNGFDMTKVAFIKLLRIHTKAMYFEPQVMIQVQNKRVKKSLGEKLSAGNQYSRNYNVMMEKKEITLSLSFKETYSRFETYGICLYYQNRLLEIGHAFWKVDQMIQDANYGRGVVGVVDITCLMDCGDESLINFKNNKHYNMFMYKLADIVHDYCDNLYIVKNGGRKDLNICISSKVDQVDLSEKINEAVGTIREAFMGKRQEARDVPRGKTWDQKEVTPPSLPLPKIGESSNSKPVIRCINCWKLRELPLGTETDDPPAAWNCNMLPYNGPCGFPADDTTMDEDDVVPLSELTRFTPSLVENNADDLDDSETDPREEYEVEKIVGAKIMGGQLHYKVKWAGCDLDGNPWKPTWEPADNVHNAAEEILEYFLRNPLKKEIFAKDGYI